MEKRKRTFISNDSLENMMEDLRRARALNNITAVIYTCVEDVHRKICYKKNKQINYDRQK